MKSKMGENENIVRERETKLYKFRDNEGTEAECPICSIQNILTPVSRNLSPRLSMQLTPWDRDYIHQKSYDKLCFCPVNPREVCQWQHVEDKNNNQKKVCVCSDLLYQQNVLSTWLKWEFVDFGDQVNIISPKDSSEPKDPTSGIFCSEIRNYFCYVRCCLYYSVNSIKFTWSVSTWIHRIIGLRFKQAV